LLKKITGEVHDSFEPFSVLKLDRVFSSMKSCTAARYNGVVPEFLKNMGPKAKQWLTLFLCNVVQETTIPRS